jgi:predicted transposase YbfD/YdcC
MVVKTTPVATIELYFSELDDPRVQRTQRHKLIDILVIAICAVICGGDDYVAMEDFGKAKEKWLRQYLELPNGIPSHDTFWRVFEALDPEQFQACFLAWMGAVRRQTQGEIVAIDGKQLRHSYDKQADKGAIHMVSAWATTNRLVLGQVKVDEKSNEITAIPELLQRLDLTGCLVTIDAMGCQTEIARLIIERGSDYLLALKGNQSNLHDDVILLFDDLEASGFTAYDYTYDKTVDKDHGRIEVRHCWTISDPGLIRFLRGAERFSGLHTVVRVRAERYVGDKHTVEDRHYIASPVAMTASEALVASRAHWQVENALHWVLDVAFREDESRVRKGNGPQNLAVLRHIALNALKQETTSKVGIKNKRLRAGWDNAYLLSVLHTLFS